MKPTDSVFIAFTRSASTVITIALLRNASKTCLKGFLPVTYKKHTAPSQPSCKPIGLQLYIGTLVFEHIRKVTVQLYTSAFMEMLSCLLDTCHMDARSKFDWK